MPAPPNKLFVPKILPVTLLNSKISTLVPPLPLHSKRSVGRGWMDTIGGRPGTSLTKQTGNIADTVIDSGRQSQRRRTRVSAPHKTKRTSEEVRFEHRTSTLTLSPQLPVLASHSKRS